MERGSFDSLSRTCKPSLLIQLSFVVDIAFFVRCVRHRTDMTSQVAASLPEKTHYKNSGNHSAGPHCATLPATCLLHNLYSIRRSPKRRSMRHRLLRMNIASCLPRHVLASCRWRAFLAGWARQGLRVDHGNSHTFPFANRKFDSTLCE